MKTNIIYQLPIPQSGCGNVQFCTCGIDSLLEFEFRNNATDWIGAIRFRHVMAYRFRDEMRSCGYASDVYETVIEVLDSDWKRQLEEIEPSGISSVSELRHFAVFLSSNGYFEVIARECTLEDVKAGLLPDSPPLLK